MYSIQNLLAECVEIERGGRGAGEYAAAWGAYTTWAKRLVDRGHSVSMPGLGVVCFKKYRYGIRLPEFELVGSLSETYGLSCKYVRALGSLSQLKENLPVHRMDQETVARVAKRAGLEAHVLRACLATAFGRLVEICVEGRAVELEVGALGTLTCIDRFVASPLSPPHFISIALTPKSVQRSLRELTSLLLLLLCDRSFPVVQKRDL